MISIVFLDILNCYSPDGGTVSSETSPCELSQDLIYFGLQSSYASFAMQNSYFNLKLLIFLQLSVQGRVGIFVAFL